MASSVVHHDLLCSSAKFYAETGPDYTCHLLLIIVHSQFDILVLRVLRQYSHYSFLFVFNCEVTH